MIIRAPLRISFVGGGSDLPDFYRVSPGRVLLVAVDKYVYVVINHTPLLKGITARYAVIEQVQNVKDLKNDRIREALSHLKIKSSLEIGVFSHLPVGTGLGGLSSFAVALIKALSTYSGKRLATKDIAEMACHLEINLIKEPIGKQDQYAAAYGGLNIFQFNPDESVDVQPVFLDFKKRINLEKQMLVFFTGLTRQASSVLTQQKKNTPNSLENLKSMVKLVDIFKNRLMKGDYMGLGEILHENWLRKKTLASNVSNEAIDQLYKMGIKNGAWGGKLLGAGGGGCIMFLAPVDKREKIKNSLKRAARLLDLTDFREVPIKFVQSGVEVVSNSQLI